MPRAVDGGNLGVHKKRRICAGVYEDPKRSALRHHGRQEGPQRYQSQGS